MGKNAVVANYFVVFTKEGKPVQRTASLNKKTSIEYFCQRMNVPVEVWDEYKRQGYRVELCDIVYTIKEKKNEPNYKT